ncbi:DUF1648 domain-containing protein [Niallia alba]|uniref:DUF1648 domain-containing protein n=1 Tax=Niallia alba TaxID=2729105 RepID=A0A7Y0K4C2_9BACI|nr:DUF5808 domain-containing protein [Niallia alba]MED3794764.1 DUF5808 domain-containing protein [Niallia alba]NMO75520.1 DUF1648 domain-containing protein [Niallia alba]
MEAIIFIIMLLITVLFEAAIPFLIRKTVVFGVSVPSTQIKHPQISTYKKRYSLFVIIPSILSIVAYCIWQAANNIQADQVAIIGTSLLFGMLFWSLSLYFYFHGKMLWLKRDNKWEEQLKEVNVTELGVRQKDEMLPWYVFIIPMIITVGFLLFTITQYHILPAEIPVHWGPDGKPDRFTTKTPLSAVTLLLVLLTMQIMFLGINIATKKSGIKMIANNKQASKHRQLKYRKYSSWFSFLTSIAVTVLFILLQLTTLYNNIFSDYLLFLIPILITVLILIGTILFTIKVERLNRGLDGKEHPTQEISSFDTDSYWKGGLFYFNKNDPSIFVEKRFGIGWTLNFANPIGYVIIFLPLLIILLLSFM